MMKFIFWCVRNPQIVAIAGCVITIVATCYFLRNEDQEVRSKVWTKKKKGRRDIRANRR